MNTKTVQCHDHDHQNCSVSEELVHHTPYAIAAVGLSLIVLSFLSFFGLGGGGKHAHDHSSGLHTLFHSFHFLHIAFATTGSIITFSRFSRNMLKGFIISLISALFFCTVSDVIVPYLAGQMLGVKMHLHICLISEMHNIVPFLLIGLLNGLIMSQHDHSNKGHYSVITHFSHIFTSALASLFYMVSEGFTMWHEQMGLLAIVLILAVVIPCTFADVIVPIFFARVRKVDEKHKAGKH